MADPGMNPLTAVFRALWNWDALAPVSNANPLPVSVKDLTVTADTINLDTSDVETKLGALTETAPASDTASSGLNGRLQRIAQRLTSLIALSLGYASIASVTRTNDTADYAANDVIGAATGASAALTFASIGRGAGEHIVTSASLEIDAGAVISGETSYKLYLYSVTPPSALGDNAAFDLPAGDRASFLGVIDLGTPVDLGSTLYVETNNINKQVTLAGTSLFGYLVTVGAYTPTASRVHKVTLHTKAV